VASRTGIIDWRNIEADRRDAELAQYVSAFRQRNPDNKEHSMHLAFNRYAAMLAAAFIAFPVSAAAPVHIPPFCVVLQLPPANCEAGKAQPCEGACPGDNSNNPAVWQTYWNRCQSQPESGGFSLAQKQFMCGAPESGELHIVYYNPSGAFVCCTKNPFINRPPDEDPVTDSQ
jgi:hypothetical protein